MNFRLLRPQCQILEVKCEKSQLIGHFDFFCPRTGNIINMHNKFEQDTWKTFEVSIFAHFTHNVHFLVLVHDESMK